MKERKRGREICENNHVVGKLGHRKSKDYYNEMTKRDQIDRK